jgi:DNA polymerase-3 subunit chi
VSKTPAPASATEAWFYHLERTGLEQALPELLEKTLQRGWKAVVRAREPDRLQQLDGWLWTYRDDSFLPHAPDDEAGAARQPILLTTGFENANGADALFLVDGAEPGELAGYARCVVLFDGADEAQLAVARAQWSAVKATGVSVSYWKQQARGWEKQA